MTTLAADAIRDFPIGDHNDLPVIASDIIYQGAAVGDNGSGYARPLVAGDPFRGFALRQVDNSAGVAGAATVRVLRRGRVVLPISALAITDVGKAVFASDDDTFTLTQGSNTCIGYVSRWISTGVGEVTFSESTGALVELTDNSGGTASDTIAAVPGSYTQATLANQIASLSAKVNALIRRMGN